MKWRFLPPGGRGGVVFRGRENSLPQDERGNFLLRLHGGKGDDFTKVVTNQRERGQRSLVF